LGIYPKINKPGGSNNRVLRWDFSPKMNKHGGSNKACSWEIFLKKNKKNSMLIRDFRVNM
jgi:hypothetical protein